MAAITSNSQTGSSGETAAGGAAIGGFEGETARLTAPGGIAGIGSSSAASRNPIRRLARGVAIVAFWTLVGLAFASQFYLSSTLQGRSVAWSQAIAYSLGDWYVWALLSIPILRFARRFPPDGKQAWRTAGIHLLAALVTSLVYVVLRSAIGQVHAWAIDEPVTFAEVFPPLLVKTFPFNLLVYGVILSVSHAIDYYRKYHERTVHTLELEKHLAEARLQALLRQLKPHFLFNTLNGIASLMHRDVDAADRMLVRLGELLRITMHQPGQALTRLRDELAFLEKYLEIERIRFGDRLAVEIVAPADTLEIEVPSLVLQPLVENAIRHGIEPQVRPGQLRIEARREGDGLVLLVRDNGDGQPPGGFTREGIGLANTRQRLRELYGDRHRFELANHPEGGLQVRLFLPR
jgi:two-component system, LytTR family, sensor kinase